MINYSFGTFYLMFLILIGCIDAPVFMITNSSCGLSGPKAQQIMIIVITIELFISITLGILTAIIRHTKERVAYYTKSIAMSFLLAALVLVGTIVL